MLCIKFVLFFALVIQLGHANEPAEACNCENPRYDSSWGRFTPTSTCEGKCNGVQLGLQECYSSYNGQILPKASCHVERPCPLPDSCEGDWSPWANEGNCERTCEQRRTRICYKNKTRPLLIRNKFCLGAEPGNAEQTRKEPCFHGACDPSSITESTSTITRRIRTSTTTTTTTNGPSEASSPLDEAVTTFFSDSTNASFYNENDFPQTDGSAENGSDAVVTLQNNGSITDPASADGNSVFLIAILGSVALVCLAVVTLGLAVVISKRRKSKADTNIAASKMSGDVTLQHGMKNPSYESYEVVGPALPQRPPIRFPPAPYLDSIYEPEPLSKEKYFESKQSTLDAENYLLPLPTPYAAPEELSGDEEAIYCNIDENKRS